MGGNADRTRPAVLAQERAACSRMINHIIGFIGLIGEKYTGLHCLQFILGRKGGGITVYFFTDVFQPAVIAGNDVQ